MNERGNTTGGPSFYEPARRGIDVTAERSSTLCNPSWPSNDLLISPCGQVE